MWWLSLGIFSSVVLIVAVLLGLIIAAAKSIDRHAAAIWIAGKQIAGNTAAIWMLDQTNTTLRKILDELRGLQQALASTDGTLRALGRAAGRKS